MITICTVLLDEFRGAPTKLGKYFEILTNSILEKTTLVKEVVAINVDKDSSYEKKWVNRDIEFRILGGKHDLFTADCPTHCCAQHAVALHQAINEAKNEYVFLCDPDVFFYLAIDEFYLNLMKKHNINIIGMSHAMAVKENFGFFPTVFNIMAKKSDLPPNDYMSHHDLSTIMSVCNEPIVKPEQQAKLIAKWLFPNNSKERNLEFPNPSGASETGCNLLLWTKEKNLRWMSFQPVGGCSLYTTQYYKTNFKITERFKRHNILYHAMTSAQQPENFERFLKEYEESKIDVNNDD